MTTPASFGRMHLMPALKNFLQAYPELSVDLRFSDSVLDLVEGGFDVAIRISELKDSSLVAKKIAGDPRIVCASPEYLAKYGMPQHPSELAEHNCVLLMGMDHWSFETPQGAVAIKAKGSIRVDNGDAMRDATTDGLGISINSKWSVYQEIASGKLVQILQDYPLTSNAAIWALYPSSRLMAPKVRAFIDYFADFYGNPPYWESAGK